MGLQIDAAVTVAPEINTAITVTLEFDAAVTVGLEFDAAVTVTLEIDAAVAVGLEIDAGCSFPRRPRWKVVSLSVLYFVTSCLISDASSYEDAAASTKS